MSYLLLQRLSLTYQKSTISYLKIGQGKSLLIALHGFGEKAASFIPICPALAQAFTVIAIDLPFHGQTQWRQEEFTLQDFIHIFQAILEQEQQSHFSLLGYSFGGRIAMSILPHLAPQIEQLFLIAPDGLNTKVLSTMMLVPVPIRQALRQRLVESGKLRQWLLLQSKKESLPVYVRKFIRHQLNSPERIEIAFQCWISANHFPLTLSKVKKYLQQHQTPTHLYLGKRDKIIPVKTGLLLAQNLANVHAYLLDTGHRMLGNTLCDLMIEQLKIK